MLLFQPMPLLETREYVEWLGIEFWFSTGMFLARAYRVRISVGDEILVGAWIWELGSLKFENVIWFVVRCLFIVYIKFVSLSDFGNWYFWNLVFEFWKIWNFFYVVREIVPQAYGAWVKGIFVGFKFGVGDLEVVLSTSVCGWSEVIFWNFNEIIFYFEQHGDLELSASFLEGGASLKGKNFFLCFLLQKCSCLWRTSQLSCWYFLVGLFEFWGEGPKQCKRTLEADGQARWNIFLWRHAGISGCFVPEKIAWSMLFGRLHRNVRSS